MNDPLKKEKANLPQKRKSLLRFGLRSLGVVVLLIAIALAYATQRINAVKAERRAITELNLITEELELVYEYQFDAELNKSLPNVPIKVGVKSLSWFSRLFNADYDSRVARMRIHVDEEHPLLGRMLKPFTRLQCLSVDSLKLKSVDFVSQIPNIKHFGIYNAQGALDVSAIQNLKQLRSLRMPLNVEPGSLQHALKNKPNLEYLWISFLQKVEELAPLEAAGNLKELVITNSEINDLKGIESLRQLNSLYLGNNPQLVGIEDIASLEQLEKLTIFNNENLKDVCAIGTLKRLQKLRLERTTVEHSKFLSTLTELQELSLSDSTLGEGLPDLVKLKQLKKVDVRRSHGLDTLRSLRGLSTPGTFGSYAFVDCPTLTSLEGLNLTAIGPDLYFSGCSSLTNIDAIRKAETVNVLHLGGCSLLNDISSIVPFDELTSLFLTECSTIEDFTPVSGKKHLAHLEISDNSFVESLPLQDSAQSLVMLTVSDCPNIKTIAGFGAMKNLGNLRLSGCGALESLEGLGQMAFLTNLGLEGCPAFTDLSALAAMVKLEKLSFSWNAAMGDCESLPNLPSVTELTMENFDGAIDLGFLKAAPKLEHLTLKNCRNLDQLACRDKQIRCPSITIEGGDFKTLVPGADFPDVSEVTLSNCQKLQRLEHVGDFPTPFLEIVRCNAIQEIAFPSAGKLCRLDVWECEALRTVNVNLMSSLETLMISGCPKLEAVDGLEALDGLRQIHLCGNVLLRELGPVKSLPSLSQISLQFCKRLEELQVVNCDALQSVSDVFYNTELKRLTLEDCDSICELEYDFTPETLQQIVIRGANSIPQQQRDLFEKMKPETRLIFETH